MTGIARALPRHSGGDLATGDLGSAMGSSDRMMRAAYFGKLERQVARVHRCMKERSDGAKHIAVKPNHSTGVREEYISAAIKLGVEATVDVLDNRHRERPGRGLRLLAANKK